MGTYSVVRLGVSLFEGLEGDIFLLVLDDGNPRTVARFSSETFAQQVADALNA